MPLIRRKGSGRPIRKDPFVKFNMNVNADLAEKFYAEVEGLEITQRQLLEGIFSERYEK